jgi:hypothetical protein
LRRRAPLSGIVAGWVDDDKEESDMRRATIKLLTVSLALVALASAPLQVAAQDAAQEAAEGSPKLVVPERILDFGTVAQGEEIHADFTLRNEGTADLHIKTVRPTCGCTVVDFPKTIAAGETGQIKAKVDTSEFTGPISKSMLLMTDDPESPSMSLVIKAAVKPYVEVLPRALVRINAIQGEKATQKLVLVADPAIGDELEITKVESSVPQLLASYRKLDKDELLDGRGPYQFELELGLGEDVEVGPMNARVMVYTNHPKAKRIVIKVFGVVRALLHVTPNRIQFGAVEAKLKPGRNVIVVNNRPQSKVMLTEATVDDPAFDAEIITIEEGRRYQVTVTIDPESRPGTRDATLTIKTTDDQFPELKVPVGAAIQ